MKKRLSIIFFVSSLLLLACKDDCDQSSCPQSGSFVFYFALKDSTGANLYDTPGSPYNIASLRIRVTYANASNTVEWDTLRGVFKPNDFVIKSRIPPATSSIELAINSSESRIFDVSSDFTSDECCGNFYSNFNVTYQGNSINLNSPYEYVIMN